MSTNFRNFPDGGIGLVPRAADPSSPGSGDLQFADGTARAIGLWQYKSGAWSQLAAASSALALTTKTTTYTATSTDQIILADATSAGFTITLPAAASSTGLTLYILKTDSSTNRVTIDANSTEVINGVLNYVLGTRYDSITITCNGTAWFLLTNNSSNSAIATSAAGQSIPNNTATIVDFGTKVKDTQNAVTTGASWSFTANVTGDFVVDANITFAANATGSRVIYLFKNGSVFRSAYRNNTGLVKFTANIMATVPMVSGDTIDVRAFQDSGGSLALSSNADENFLNVKKSGN